MDTLYLPYLTGSDTIQFALERMKQTNSKAIVVAHEQAGTALYMNHEIVRAWIDRVSFCEDLPHYGGERVEFLTQTIEAPEPTHVYWLLERQLDQRQAKYGMLFSPQRGTRGVTLVFTRSEEYAYAILDAEEACYCEGPKPHEEKHKDPNTGNCRVCGHSFDCI